MRRTTTTTAGPTMLLAGESASFHTPKPNGIIQRWLLRKTGLEVALSGVDGSGKTSVATALYRLPFPVKVISMGSAHFAWLPTRPAVKRFFPWPVLQLLMHCERLRRRWLGFCLACCGWIIIYDRHPLEQINTQPALLKHRINNCLFYLYGWPVDLTFWLTGNYQKIYERKKEFSADHLRILDDKISDVIAYRHIDHLKLNVTEKDLDAVVNALALQISTRYKADSQEQTESTPAV